MSDLKSTESQFSLEKKIIRKSFLDQFLSKSEKGPSKSIENDDSGVPTRKNQNAEFVLRSQICVRLPNVNKKPIDTVSETMTDG